MPSEVPGSTKFLLTFQNFVPRLIAASFHPYSPFAGRRPVV